MPRAKPCHMRFFAAVASHSSSSRPRYALWYGLMEIPTSIIASDLIQRTRSRANASILPEIFARSFDVPSAMTAATHQPRRSRPRPRPRPRPRQERARRSLSRSSMPTFAGRPLTKAAALLLSAAPPACRAFVSYREVLNHYPHHTSNLPVPLSDHSVAFSMAPNINGDLTTGIYLIGGCQSDYISYMDPHAMDGIDTSEKNIEAIPQYRCDQVSPEVTFYDPETDWFEPRKHMRVGRHRHVAVGVSGVIWVVGGRDSNDHVIPEVEVYDPGCEHWVTLGTLPAEFAVSDAARFVYEEDLYVAGGYNSNYDAVKTTIKIDTEATLKRNGVLCRLDGGGGGGRGIVFERVADLNTERGATSGVSYGRYGYVLGGYTHTDGHCQPHNSVEIYNVQANIWEYGGNLAEGRAAPAVVKYKGRFFVVGGEKRTGTHWGWESCPTDELQVKTNRRHPRRKSSPVNSVEIYDPLDGIEGTWTKIQGSLPHDERYRFALAPWPAKEQIYSFGGVTNRDYDGMTPCDDCLHVINDMITYADESERYETQTTWWGEFWVILSSITFAATIISAIIGQIPAVRLLYAQWRSGGEGGSGAKGGRGKKSSALGGDGDDDISLVDMADGGPRGRTDTKDLSRGEIL